MVVLGSTPGDFGTAKIKFLVKKKILTWEKPDFLILHIHVIDHICLCNNFLFLTVREKIFLLAYHAFSDQKSSQNFYNQHQ